MTEFTVKESDKMWLKNLVALMNNGAVWGSSFAIYTKIDDETLAVIEGNINQFSAEQVEDNINRTKVVAEAIGLKFIDKRKKKE
jgi:hypothetical protein